MIDYILHDYQSHRARMVAEILGMLCALGVAILLAGTTPHPPMVPVYLGWNVASILLGVSAYSRGSLGLTITYGAFLVIDTYGLFKTLGVL